MPSGIARIHGNKSNRASTAKLATVEDKVVFKSVLSNPFEVKWPSTPVNIANSVLARIVSLAEGVADYHLARETESRKRKRERRGRPKPSNDDTNPSKRIKLPARPSRHQTSPEGEVGATGSLPPTETQTDASDASASMEMSSSSQAKTSKTATPPILKHLCIGINEVTKRLEAQAKARRTAVARPGNKTPPQAEDQPPATPISVVLVCKGDVNPPLLVAHLPPLVAACNSSRRGSATDNSTPNVKLVPFPKGAEATLTAALGLRRSAVIALESDTPGVDGLLALLNSVPTVMAPWLSHSTTETSPGRSLEPTHIKQVRTSAPRDMKAAKEQRARGKADARARKIAKTAQKLA